MLVELARFGATCFPSFEMQLVLNSNSTREFHLGEAEFCE